MDTKIITNNLSFKIRFEKYWYTRCPEALDHNNMYSYIFTKFDNIVINGRGIKDIEDVIIKLYKTDDIDDVVQYVTSYIYKSVIYKDSKMLVNNNNQSCNTLFADGHLFDKKYIVLEIFFINDEDRIIHDDDNITSITMRVRQLKDLTLQENIYEEFCY